MAPPVQIRGRVGRQVQLAADFSYGAPDRATNASNSGGEAPTAVAAAGAWKRFLLRAGIAEPV
jgi:hypothetical protein